MIEHGYLSYVWRSNLKNKEKILHWELEDEFFVSLRLLNRFTIY